MKKSRFVLWASAPYGLVCLMGREIQYVLPLDRSKSLGLLIHFNSSNTE